MKIIDFEHKGNVVRFYLGEDNLENWYGDDWDDAPYEHNAGTVYDDYISGTMDVAFPFDSLVLEPHDDWMNRGNSDWSKDDMRQRMVPCIIVIPKDKIHECQDRFGFYIGMDGIQKYYFGDSDESFQNLGNYIIEYGEKKDG